MAERARRIEDIFRDIADKAENISRTVEQIGERSKVKPDWRGYVKDSPYWALGAAAILGYAASSVFNQIVSASAGLTGTKREERIMSP